jgi:K+-sensing histidine kinase KdpD
MAQLSSTVAVEPLSDAGMSDDSSHNVLVHLTGTDADQRLVREAGRYVAGTGGELVLVSVLSSKEFVERQHRYASLSALPTYTLNQAKESRRQRALRAGRHALDSLEIDYTPVGMVGDETKCLLTAARRHDCGHLFLVERRRSRFRRLFVRNLGPAIAWKFDGLVTVLQADSEEETDGKRRSIAGV